MEGEINKNEKSCIIIAAGQRVRVYNPLEVELERILGSGHCLFTPQSSTGVRVYLDVELDMSMSRTCPRRQHRTVAHALHKRQNAAKPPSCITRMRVLPSKLVPSRGCCASASNVEITFSAFPCAIGGVRPPGSTDRGSSDASSECRRSWKRFGSITGSIMTGGESRAMAGNHNNLIIYVILMARLRACCSSSGHL